MEAKEKVDGGTAGAQEVQENDCINAFHALTTVRAMLADGLRGGAPADVPHMKFHGTLCWC